MYTNLNSTGNFIAFNLGLNPFIDNKWPCGMDHYTGKEVCEYLSSKFNKVHSQQKLQKFSDSILNFEQSIHMDNPDFVMIKK